jgi:hypothetical protein
VLPLAVGLATTALAAAHGPLWLRAGVEVVGPYVVGRVLADAPMGRLLAALSAGTVLGGLLRPSHPWWWTFALLLPGLVVLGLLVSIGQLHARRRRGDSDVGVTDLGARVGALVSLVSLTLVGVLIFMSTAGERLDLEARSVERQVSRALSLLDVTIDDRSALDRSIASVVDAPLVRSSWDGERLRVWFEVRLGILPVRCVTGIGDGVRWSTAVHTGPCT